MVNGEKGNMLTRAQPTQNLFQIATGPDGPSVCFDNEIIDLESGPLHGAVRINSGDNHASRTGGRGSMPFGQRHNIYPQPAAEDGTSRPRFFLVTGTDLYPNVLPVALPQNKKFFDLADGGI